MLGSSNLVKQKITNVVLNFVSKKSTSFLENGTPLQFSSFSGKFRVAKKDFKEVKNISKVF